MYEDAETEIQRIVQLVEACPELLREKAFEILLQGYVNSLAPSPPLRPPPTPGQLPPPPPPQYQSWRDILPEEIKPRLDAMAQRIKVAPEKLAALFDFSSDPFSYAPLHVDGKSTRQRVQRVAMLVAARSYLATGRWSADWAEIKAMCTHQNCYDMGNFAATLKKEEGSRFKSVASGASVQLAATGQKEAENLLATLATGSDAAQE